MQVRQGHGSGQVRDTLTGLISTQPINEALDTVGQTQLEQAHGGHLKCFNPTIIKQIRARTWCQTHRPEGTVGNQK